MIRIDKSRFNLQKAIDRHKVALGIYADAAAKKMEAEAKRDAPWTDRTTHARQSIDGRKGWKGNQLVVRLSGGPDYFVYLELAYEKRFSILKPTIDRNAPDILRGYQKLVNG